MEAVFFVIVVAIALGAVGFSFWQRQQLNETWRQLAEEAGFEFYEGSMFSYPSMTGQVEGISVDVDIEVRGSGKNKQIFTRVRGTVPGMLPMGLSLSHEGWLHSFGKMLGAQDIQVGIPELDDGLMIKGDSPFAVTEWFRRPEAQLAARQVIAAGSGMSVEHNAVKLLWHGLQMGPKVQSMIDTAVSVAQNLGEASDKPLKSEVAPEATAGRSLSAQLREGPAPTHDEVDKPPPPLPDSPVAAKLREIGDAFVSRARREELIAELAEEDLVFDALVTAIEPSKHPELPEDLKQGQTVRAKAGTVALCLRYAPSWNDYVETVERGGVIPVMGRIVAWDPNDQRVILDVR